MPEKAVPAKLTETGWLYQPFASGGRSGVAVADGAEISTCSGKLRRLAATCQSDPTTRRSDTVVSASV